MFLRTAATALVLLMTGLPAVAQDTVSAADPEGVAGVLRDLGYRAQMDSADNGDPLIRSAADGTNFRIWFYGCDGKNGNCTGMNFSAGFDLEQRHHLRGDRRLERRPAARIRQPRRRERPVPQLLPRHQRRHLSRSLRERDLALGTCRGRLQGTHRLRGLIRRRGRASRSLRLSRSVSLFNWPQAAKMSRPRGVRTGEA